MTHLLRMTAFVLLLIATPLLAGEVPLGDDGLHKPDWLKDSFKILPEDMAEAAAADRHLLLIVEQRGCIYCAQLHNEVLTDPRIDTLIRDHFDVVQIDLFGGTEITDADGEVLAEKRAAGKWGVTITPMMLFLPQVPVEGADAARSAVAMVPGVPDTDHTLALLEWVRDGGPATGRNLSDILE